MSKKSESPVHSDDSDDDSLPPILGFRLSVPEPSRKKTFEELYKESVVLSKDQEQDRKNEEILAATATLPNAEASIGSIRLDETLLSDEEDETLTTDDLSVHLFGELNQLHFFALHDTSLSTCGYDSSLNLSKQEQALISLDEKMLHKKIKCGLSDITVSKIMQLNPFIRYVLRTMSLHTDEAYVEVCEQLIKRLLVEQCNIESISISNVDIFMILFNYGVDLEKGEIFNMLPEIEKIPTRPSAIAEEMPGNWKFNLKVLLSTLRHLIDCCKFKNEDLFNVVIYLLWMSIDDLLLKSGIYSELERCIAVSLRRFPQKYWPIFRSNIALSVMLENLSLNNKWSYVLKMVRSIPCSIDRGIQLRKYISYLALRRLTDNVVDTSTAVEYSNELFTVSELSSILPSICNTGKLEQLISVKFIDIFINHLQLKTQEDYHQLYRYLKLCDISLGNHISEAQAYLIKIHSRVCVMAPQESVKCDVYQETGEDLNPSAGNAESSRKVSMQDTLRNPDRPSSLPLISKVDDSYVDTRRHVQRISSPERWEIKQDVYQETGEDLNPYSGNAESLRKVSMQDTLRNPDRPSSLPLISKVDDSDVDTKRLQRISSPERLEIKQDVYQETGEDLNPSSGNAESSRKVSMQDTLRNPDRPSSLPLFSKVDDSDVDTRRLQRISSPGRLEIKQVIDTKEPEREIPDSRNSPHPSLNDIQISNSDKNICEVPREPLNEIQNKSSFENSPFESASALNTKLSNDKEEIPLHSSGKLNNFSNELLCATTEELEVLSLADNYKACSKNYVNSTPHSSTIADEVPTKLFKDSSDNLNVLSSSNQIKNHDSLDPELSIIDLKNTRNIQIGSAPLSNEPNLVSGGNIQNSAPFQYLNSSEKTSEAIPVLRNDNDVAEQVCETLRSRSLKSFSFMQNTGDIKNKGPILKMKLDSDDISSELSDPSKSSSLISVECNITTNTVQLKQDIHNKTNFDSKPKSWLLSSFTEKSDSCPKVSHNAEFEAFKDQTALVEKNSNVGTSIQGNKLPDASKPVGASVQNSLYNSSNVSNCNKIQHNKCMESSSVNSNSQPKVAPSQSSSSSKMSGKARDETQVNNDISNCHYEPPGNFVNSCQDPDFDSKPKSWLLSSFTEKSDSCPKVSHNAEFEAFKDQTALVEKTSNVGTSIQGNKLPDASKPVVASIQNSLYNSSNVSNCNKIQHNKCMESSSVNSNSQPKVAPSQSSSSSKMSGKARDETQVNNDISNCHYEPPGNFVNSCQDPDFDSKPKSWLLSSFTEKSDSCPKVSHNAEFEAFKDQTALVEKTSNVGTSIQGNKLPDASKPVVASIQNSLYNSSNVSNCNKIQHNKCMESSSVNSNSQPKVAPSQSSSSSKMSGKARDETQVNNDISNCHYEPPGNFVNSCQDPDIDSKPKSWLLSSFTEKSDSCPKVSHNAEFEAFKDQTALVEKTSNVGTSIQGNKLPDASKPVVASIQNSLYNSSNVSNCNKIQHNKCMESSSVNSNSQPKVAPSQSSSSSKMSGKARDETQVNNDISNCHYEPAGNFVNSCQDPDFDSKPKSWLLSSFTEKSDSCPKVSHNAEFEAFKDQTALVEKTSNVGTSIQGNKLPDASKPVVASIQNSLYNSSNVSNCNKIQHNKCMESSSVNSNSQPKVAPSQSSSSSKMSGKARDETQVNNDISNCHYEPPGNFVNSCQDPKFWLLANFIEIPSTSSEQSSKKESEVLKNSVVPLKETSPSQTLGNKNDVQDGNKISNKVPSQDISHSNSNLISINAKRDHDYSSSVAQMNHKDASNTPGIQAEAFCDTDDFHKSNNLQDSAASQELDALEGYLKNIERELKQNIDQGTCNIVKDMPLSTPKDSSHRLSSAISSLCSSPPLPVQIKIPLLSTPAKQSNAVHEMESRRVNDLSGQVGIDRDRNNSSPNPNIVYVTAVRNRNTHNFGKNLVIQHVDKKTAIAFNKSLVPVQSRRLAKEGSLNFTENLVRTMNTSTLSFVNQNFKEEDVKHKKLSITQSSNVHLAQGKLLKGVLMRNSSKVNTPSELFESKSTTNLIKSNNKLVISSVEPLSFETNVDKREFQTNYQIESSPKQPLLKIETPPKTLPQSNQSSSNSSQMLSILPKDESSPKRKLTDVLNINSNKRRRIMTLYSDTEEPYKCDSPHPSTSDDSNLHFKQKKITSWVSNFPESMPHSNENSSSIYPNSSQQSPHFMMLPTSNDTNRITSVYSTGVSHLVSELKENNQASVSNGNHQTSALHGNHHKSAKNTDSMPNLSDPSTSSSDTSHSVSDTTSITSDSSSDTHSVKSDGEDDVQIIHCVNNKSATVKNSNRNEVKYFDRPKSAQSSKHSSTNSANTNLPPFKEEYTVHPSGVISLFNFGKQNPKKPVDSRNSCELNSPTKKIKLSIKHPSVNRSNSKEQVHHDVECLDSDDSDCCIINEKDEPKLICID